MGMVAVFQFNNQYQMQYVSFVFWPKIMKIISKKENHLKDVQKGLRAIAVGECLLFVEDSLQSSNEVESFIKLFVIQKFYFLCLENRKTPV